MALLLGLSAAAIAAVLCFARKARTAADPQEPASPPSEIALVGARVYVSPFRRSINNGVIIIRNGKIAAVGGHSKVKVPEGVGSVNCSGMYIMAGFQNSDVQLTEPQWNNAAQLPAAELAEDLQQMFTKYGFTTVANTGADFENTLALRKRIESGGVLGPRILTAGSPLYPPNGVPESATKGLPPSAVSQLPQPKNAAEAVRDVGQQIGQGADIINLFAGSSISQGHVANMPLGVAIAAVNEAHEKGKLVLAHPGNAAGFEIALQSHVDVIAQSAGDTAAWSHNSIRQTKGRGIWLIPTLTLFMHDPSFDEILDGLYGFSQSHEQILFGTDAGVTESDPSDEYVLMRRAGLDFWHILDTLTTAPAKRFGESSIRGEISPGMNADLVVVGQDPEHDIRALTHVNFTFRDGRVIYSYVQ